MAGKIAAGAALLVWLAGCIGVPDAEQMRGIRAESAERRLADLAEKTTTDSGVYLSGPLLL